MDFFKSGGADEIRTRVHGFAIRCVASPPPRQCLNCMLSEPITKPKGGRNAENILNYQIIFKTTKMCQTTLICLFALKIEGKDCHGATLIL